MKHVKAHRAEKEKKVMTKEQSFVVEENGKADELAKERSEVDDGQLAAARASTVKQMRKQIYASIGILHTSR